MKRGVVSSSAGWPCQTGLQPVELNVIFYYYLQKFTVFS